MCAISFGVVLPAWATPGSGLSPNPECYGRIAAFINYSQLSICYLYIQALTFSPTRCFQKSVAVSRFWAFFWCV